MNMVMEEVTMNLSNKRCGECGQNAYAKQSIKGQWKKPWKDFPSVFLTKSLEIWVCSACGCYASASADAARIDEALESSIRDQISQFLDVIHSKSGLTFEVIAQRLGYSASYVSTLRQRNATPAFKLWNQLKSISINPKQEMANLDPDYDIIENNILLRA
jgi:hypothetical protein